MEINYIIHEYFEDDYSRFNFDKHNLVVVPTNSNFVNENKLVFGPIIMHGTILLKKCLQNNLKQIGWPDMLWPFYEKDFSYSSMVNYQLLNEDRRFYNSLSHLFENEKKYPIWVRSNSGDKTFSGGVFSKKQLEEEVINFQNRSWDFPVVCANRKKIKAEYRCVIIGGEYVSGSQYMLNGELNESPEVNPVAIVEAQYYAQRFGIKNAVIDVADTSKGTKILELNSLRTSGFYKADFAKILEAQTNEVKKALDTRKKYDRVRI